jgi:hypothetical protein
MWYTPGRSIISGLFNGGVFPGLKNIRNRTDKVMMVIVSIMASMYCDVFYLMDL